MARRIGLDRDTFRKISIYDKNGHNYPSATAILPLARELQKAGYPIPGYYVSDEPVVSVPLFRAPLPVKKGKPVWQNAPAGALAFAQAHLASLTMRPPHELAIWEHQGDHYLVDTTITTPQGTGLYLVLINDTPQPRDVEPGTKTTKVGIEILPNDELPPILGRVIWIGKRV